MPLSQKPPYHGLRSSADYLFKSVAKVCGATAVGVILASMGKDGAESLPAIRDTGAHTMAQNETKAVVFGMPAVAIEIGAAQRNLPAQKVAAANMTLV